MGHRLSGTAATHPDPHRHLVDQRSPILPPRGAGIGVPLREIPVALDSGQPARRAELRCLTGVRLPSYRTFLFALTDAHAQSAQSVAVRLAVCPSPS
jgi:hypothetical protein